MHDPFNPLIKGHYLFRLKVRFSVWKGARAPPIIISALT